MGDDTNNQFQSGTKPNGVDIPEMLRRLDKLYDEEEQIKAEAIKHQEAFRKLQILYEQKREEIDLMQNMIMHMSNKKRRQSEFEGKRF